MKVNESRGGAVDAISPEVLSQVGATVLHRNNVPDALLDGNCSLGRL